MACVRFYEEGDLAYLWLFEIEHECLMVPIRARWRLFSLQLPMGFNLASIGQFGFYSWDLNF